MNAIRPHDGVMKIALYEGGASTLPGMGEVLKLSANENPFGPSEAAREALRRAAFRLHRYPPADHAALRAAIAGVHGLDAGRIVCGAGSDELISLLAQAYCGPGAQVIHTEHGFAMYRIAALAAGAEPVEVAERERRVDVEAIRDAAGPRTRLVFIANPANPTGTMLSDDEVAWLAGALPAQTLLVLDGAYADYVDGFDGGAGLVEARENVVMTRTFSKIHGLGGLRVGWACGPAHVVDALGRVRGPFNLGWPQLEAAEAAMRDTGHVARSRDENARLRSWMAEALAGIGIASDPSYANFVLARFADAAEAEAADAHLRESGIIVRRVAGYGLPAALRITVGDEAGCRRVVHALRRFRENAA